MAPEDVEGSQFRSLYLDDLINYTVLVHCGAGHIGSGVLVRAGNRHLVATAKHLLEGPQLPQVLMSPTRATRDGSTVEPIAAPVMCSGQHERLDIAYLEITDPQRAEIDWSQLSSDRIVSGQVQIVGFPGTLHQIDRGQREYSVAAACFSTHLVSETDEVLRFAYPESGIRLNHATGEWADSPFPATPRGFSGGGCFGVVQGQFKGLAALGYRLLGIQYEWSRSERYVRVVPIRHWCDLIVTHGLYCPSS